jgi:YidC/Oxa1 family membrane protein insertase
MGGNNREFFLAIALSAVVLIAWQVFFGIPQIEEERARQEAQQTQQTEQTEQTQPQGGGDSTIPQVPDQTAQPGDSTIPSLPGDTAVSGSRDTVLAATRRIPIETPRLQGSINLTGGRIDDLQLRDYRETVKPDSPVITLLSPSGAPSPYYAEFGWTVPRGGAVAVPGPRTEWTAERGASLTPAAPVTLTWENGDGLTFHRTIAIDDRFMFSVEDTVENASGSDVTLHPYALVSRHGMPAVENFLVLHEGLIGVLGEKGLQEIDYDDLDEDSRTMTYSSTGGWLGMTDKYWAVALIPDQAMAINAHFRDTPRNGKDIYQADYLNTEGMTVPAGGVATSQAHLFAGAKVVSIIDSYQDSLGVENFELLIDWGWFYFITKPLFWLVDFLYGLVGNFGVAILLVTVIIKLIFFPLANKSYVSMAKMKGLQPQVMKLRERYKDDRQKQQQEMMALYKKEKVNPMAGCLPIVIQIPVFFALYKVLYGTIEMRHAPFVGWIQDLSAPDPTSIFNLFGLVPWDPPSFLMIGLWPLIMGVTMFVQMRLNPPPPDPTQAMIFTWMPVFFTFLLATFPAGLIIYWAWNNLLSITQQWVIMRRQGVKVDLFKNIKEAFKFGKAKGESESGS